MRRFVNLFLILFLVDGGLSLLDEMLSIGLQLELLSGPRNLVSFVVLLLAGPLYLALGIDQRLPKRIILPLTVFVLWGAFAFWPLPALSAGDVWLLFASVGQLLLGIMSIVYLRKVYGRSLLPAEMFDPPFFSLRNTLLYSTANILLLPVTLVFLGLASANYYMEKQTAGFMRISPVGIHMAERIYRLDGKVVRLAAMMHIGEEEYYDDLADSVTNGGTIILAEGVTDGENLLKSRFEYGRMGDMLGLVSQEQLEFQGEMIEIEELDAPGRGVADRNIPHIVRADVDVSEFDPQTIEFLNVMGETFFNADSGGMKAYKAWVDAHMTPELLVTILEDILYHRNEVVIRVMNRSLKSYDNVVIPWGAMHMPAIEEAIVREGFSMEEKRERLSLDFRKIPYADLWRKVRSPDESTLRRPQ